MPSAYRSSDSSDKPGDQVSELTKRLKDQIAENSMRDAEDTLNELTRLLKDTAYPRNLKAAEVLELLLIKTKIFNWRREHTVKDFSDHSKLFRQEQMPEKSPYEVLGVPFGTSKKEIKAAYRKLVKEHHPDVNGNSEESTAKFKEIQKAYDRLMDSSHKA